MSIKLETIYNYGGGGGGYKDGGQLIDGEFIKVENNTASSFDNVSRDTINFYFETKDGEILNSFVELTTAVNSTVNVYIYKNGIYSLIGSIGANTVNAGEEYNVTIKGNSYVVLNVSSLTPEPSYFEFSGNSISPAGIIKLTKINGKYWSDYIQFSSDNNDIIREHLYYDWYLHKSYIDPWLNSGWRLPTSYDVVDLINNYTPAEYYSLLGFKKLGQWKQVTTNIYAPDGEGVYSYQYNEGSPRAYGVDENGDFRTFNPVFNIYYPMRLVRDSL